MTVLPADLHVLREDLLAAANQVTARARRRHRAGLAVSVLLVLGAFAGAAVAAVSLLGRAAPSGVQRDLHRAARFEWNGHSGLQVQKAVVVAVSADATLYSVRDNRGNFCAELVGTGKALIFGFSCSLSRGAPNGETLTDDAGTSVDYAVPSDGIAAPVVEFGRLPLHTTSARVVFANGVIANIQLGLDGFFVWEPTGRLQTLARRLPLTLEFLDRTGQPVWSYYVQPPQPLHVEGAGPSLISGHVVIAGARKVRVNVSPFLSAPSTIVNIRIRGNGSFAWTGHPGERVYSVTVVDGHGLAVSADAQPLTSDTIAEMSALQKRNR
jgi:hypothetical protein